MEQIEPNRAIARELIEAFGRLDVQRVKEIVSPDADWWVVGRAAEKRDAFLDAFRSLHTGPVVRGHVDILDLIAEGTRVVVEWTGSLEFADGRTYSNEYVWIMTVRDAQVIDIRVYNNMDKIRAFFQPVQSP